MPTYIQCGWLGRGRTGPLNQFPLSLGRGRLLNPGDGKRL